MTPKDGIERMIRTSWTAAALGTVRIGPLTGLCDTCASCVDGPVVCILVSMGAGIDRDDEAMAEGPARWRMGVGGT